MVSSLLATDIGGCDGAPLLHQLAAARAPAWIITQALTALASAAHAALCAYHNALLPLHLSLLCGAPLECSLLLLSQCPRGQALPRTQTGVTPLACALLSPAPPPLALVHRLLELDGDAAAQPHGNGLLPLHICLLATEGGAQLRAALALAVLGAYPQAALVPLPAAREEDEGALPDGAPPPPPPPHALHLAAHACPLAVAPLAAAFPLAARLACAVPAGAAAGSPTAAAAARCFGSMPEEHVPGHPAAPE